MLLSRASAIAASLDRTFGATPLLQELCAKHPGITLSLNLSDGIVNLIEDGMDVAVRIGEFSPSAYRTLKAASVRRIVCASPAYLRRPDARHISRQPPGPEASLRLPPCPYQLDDPGWIDGGDQFHLYTITQPDRSAQAFEGSLNPDTLEQGPVWWNCNRRIYAPSASLPRRFLMRGSVCQTGGRW